MQLLQQQLQGGGALDPRILALCQQVSQLQVRSPGTCRPPTAGAWPRHMPANSNCTALSLGMLWCVLHVSDLSLVAISQAGSCMVKATQLQTCTYRVSTSS